MTGGRDGKTVLFDLQNKQIVKKIDATDSKKPGVVTVSKFVPGQDTLFALIGSSDSNAGIWSLDYS